MTIKTTVDCLERFIIGTDPDVPKKAILFYQPSDLSALPTVYGSTKVIDFSGSTHYVDFINHVEGFIQGGYVTDQNSLAYIDETKVVRRLVSRLEMFAASRKKLSKIDVAQLPVAVKNDAIVYTVGARSSAAATMAAMIVSREVAGITTPSCLCLCCMLMCGCKKNAVDVGKDLGERIEATKKRYKDRVEKGEIKVKPPPKFKE